MNAQELIDTARMLITGYKLRAPIVNFCRMLWASKSTESRPSRSLDDTISAYTTM